MKTQRDLTGMKFERLTVVGRDVQAFLAGKRPSWICRCDCGSEVSALRGNLLKGNTRSCGCIKSRHGMAKTRIYSSWRQMRQRCENPNDASFDNYGGRGIKVCDRWQVFENFYEDMGEPPRGATLDRIDNDGPYSPENCRWARWSEQSNNKRTSRMITAFGKTQSLTQWANEYNISPLTLTQRLDRGKWSVEDALLLDKRRGRKPD